VTTKLPIGVLTGKCPLDGSVLGVAPSLPGSHLFCDELLVADSTIQALAAECRNLDFGHVQPTGVLGCVVEDDAAQEFARHPRTKNLDEARSEVSVEVVEDQVDAPRGAINGVDQVLHEGDEVRLASMVRDGKRQATFGQWLGCDF